MENNLQPTGHDRSIANRSKDHIPGWGIDNDPENDPTYPMKRWNGADHERLNYDRPAQQPIDREVLKSIERPTLTRVFGTSSPPSGLSGMIRRFAYKYSEASAIHWMGLILADRVNVAEGIVEDLGKGHVPDFIHEMGLASEWKYNRKAFVTKVALQTAFIAGVCLVLSQRKKYKRKR